MGGRSQEDPHRIGDPVEDEKIDLDVAKQVCENALGADPENPRIIFQLGKVYYYRGETGKALELLERSSAKNYAASSLFWPKCTVTVSM